MAKNQSTYTLKIDAELGNLQKILNEAKTSLTSFMQSGNAPKGLEKAFEKIKDLLGQISDKTGKPLDLKGLTSTGKDLSIIQENFKAIIRLLGEFDDLSDDIKLSFLSVEEQKKVTAVIDALKTYGTAAEESAKKVKLLDAAQKNLAKDEANLGKAKKKVSGLEKDKVIKTAKLSGAEGKLAAVKGLENVNPKDVAKYEAEVAKLRAELTNLDNDLANANEELTKARTTYDTSAASIKKMEAEIKRASGASLKQLKEEAQKLGISLEGLNGRKAADQVDILTTRLEEFKKEVMNGAKPTFDEITKGCKTAEESVEKLGDDVKQATETVKEMDEVAAQRDAFEAKIRSFLGLQGAAQLMRAALRDAIQTITELDATMADMAVVTDLDISDYWDQLPQYTERANELGLAIGDVYKADTLFYQQGLKTNEVVAISTETMKMASIAGLDTAEATDRMTAALRGFNMELNEASAQKIADVYSELAAITAADVDEISTAMTKTASIASSAGMEFETTAAFLSQIIETTRESAETAGTAMKTVIARFQELKKSPDEIGEVDGEIVDANAIETALRSVGVSLRDAGGQFRELDDVFLELSGKWSTLDKNTQRYIATIAAGSRQQSRFIAMMSDYKRTTELVTAANNSAGASQEQFEKKAESLEFKINQLKNAWHEFTMGIMESDLVKFGVDILTKFLEIVNKATSGIEGLGGSVVKIVSILSIFKMGMAIFKKFRSPLVNFFSDVVKLSYEKGEESMKAFKKGSEEGAQDKKEQEPKSAPEGYTRDNNGRLHDEKGFFLSKEEEEWITYKPKEKRTIKNWAIDKTGINGIKEGFSTMKNNEAREQYAALVNSDKGGKKERLARLQQAEKDKEKAMSEGASQEKLDEYDEKIKVAKKDIVELQKIEEKYMKESQKGWNSLGKGLGQMGQAVAGVGIGMSALGGILSSLGLEEFGDGLAEAGNYITIFGSILMTLPGIFSAISSAATAAGITISAALWMVTLIVAAVALVSAIIISIVSSMNASAKAAKEAAEQTEAAKATAQEAKEAYDDLLSNKDKYDELQNALEELTYGTKEWKQALIEANQQVMELLTTYPQLAKYLTRGKDGQLIIKDEGWDEAIKAQEESVRVTQGMVGQKMATESNLKKEQAEKDFTNKVSIITTVLDGEGNTDAVKSEQRASALEEDLTDIYFTQGKDLEKNSEEIEKLAEEYQLTTDQIWSAAEALEESKDEMETLAFEAENFARANLTASASEGVLSHELGADVIDAFAGSQGGTYMTNEVDEKKKGMDETSDYAENEEFMALAREYNVGSSMTGDDLQDLQTLYKAMAGVENIPDEIAEDEDKLLEAIAQMDQSKEQSEKMEQYLNKLDNIQNKEDKQNISSLLSQSGMGMSLDYAQSLMKDGELNKELLLEEAKKLGYDSIDAWAGALNKTTADFYDEVEKNARMATTANTKAFERLNQALGKTENKVKKIGEGLSIEQEKGLADKIVNVANLAGTDAAGEVFESLENALNKAGDDAGALANQLTSINWQDATAWENLPDTLSSMGIIWTEEIEIFIEQARRAAGALKIVDFSKLNSDLKSVYDTLKAIKSGDQKREFEEEGYNRLIASNKDLAKEFVQVGDKYVYIGTSMNNLTNALEKNTLSLMDSAKIQYAAKIDLANVAADMEKVSFRGEDLDLSSDTTKWSTEAKRAFLESYQAAALEKFTSDGKITDERALSYLDEAGTGLSFTTDFETISDSTLNTMIAQIKDNLANLQNLTLEEKKVLEDSQILAYTFRDSLENVTEAQNLRASKNEDEADLVSKALLTQASQSGLISEAVLARYSELIEMNSQDMTEKEADEMKSLEATIQSNLERIAKNQEGTEALIELQNRVADAIYNTRQKEIDKLSEVNESIQSANGSLINKLQEQIDFDRQKRQQEETEKNIANLQSQQAYLAMDTSGGNILEQQNIEQEIEQAEQDYQDSLVDQAIQQLSDANEKAAEQRERQINLLQQQLDYSRDSGQIMQEAVAITNESLASVNEGTDFMMTDAARIIKQGEDWHAYSEEEKKKIEGELSKTAAAAADTKTNTEDVVDNTGGKDDKDNLATTTSNIETLVGHLTDERTTRKQAVLKAATLVSGTSGGFGVAKDTEAYKALQDQYVAAGGDADSFENMIRNQMTMGGQYVDEKGEKKTIRQTTSNGYAVVNKAGEIISGDFPDGYAYNFDSHASGYWDDNVSVSLNGENISGLAMLDNDSIAEEYDEIKNELASDAEAAALNELVGGDPGNGQIAMLNKEPFIYRNGRWVKPSQAQKAYKTLKEKMFNYLNSYQTGGLADFTGPAWLDGTKSRPEYVLNAAQTERFFSLVDVLEGFDKQDTSNKSTGDNYFDINIQVEKLESDYDVEQVADKIRKMIYEDASYRNVNAINLIR